MTPEDFLERSRAERRLAGMPNFFTATLFLIVAVVGAPARAAVSALPDADPAAAFPSWTLSLGVGPLALFESKSSTPSWSLGGQLEGHRHLGRWFLGPAIDVGPRDVHPFGGALVFGGAQSVGRLHLEASVGLGVEEYRVQVISPGGPFTEKQAAGYGRVAFAVSYPLVADLDVLAQLTGHFTATTHANPTFAVATVGVRLRLP
ncbi:MAG: hypothetical protein JWM82_2469 [Myxococcales bacterium]|nr:hypothetical protein [Myxococcales bacterium]